MKRAIRKKIKLLALATKRNTVRCIFCSSPDVTWEHVFSRWTHRYLSPPPKPRARIFVEVLGAKGRETLNYQMTGPMRDWQIKCVCGGDKSTCNNGWMRDIEESAAPILVPLMLGQNVRISEADQKLIATWAILKVMVVNHRMVHHLQRKQMRHKRAPPRGWGVWIGNYERKTGVAEWLPRSFSLLPDRIFARRKSLDRNPNSHATTQIFKKLLIHVVYCGHPSLVNRWRFSGPNVAPISGQMIRIWPPAGCSIAWPLGSPLTDADAATVADAMLNSVMQVAARLGLLKIVR